jgi:hypothetical protein
MGAFRSELLGSGFLPPFLKTAAKLPPMEESSSLLTLAVVKLLSTDATDFLSRERSF